MGGVRVRLASGVERVLAASLGSNPMEVLDAVTEQAMTGSAVESRAVWISTEDGGAVRLADVAEFLPSGRPPADATPFDKPEMEPRG